MVETFNHLFDQTALRLDGKKAIYSLRKGKLESQITYSSLQQISNRVANGLIEMGLRTGDRAILFMPKSMEQVVFHLGVQMVGAISVILNPGFKRDEMNYFLEDTDAKILIVGKKEEPLIRSIDEKRRILSIDTETPFNEEKLFPGVSSQIVRANVSLHDPALLIYTYGTTGQLKGAILTQQIILQDAKNILHIILPNKSSPSPLHEGCRIPQIISRVRERKKCGSRRSASPTMNQRISIQISRNR